MNKLINYDNKEQKLIFSPYALTLKAFKKIWDRDSSEDKGQAISDLSFCYFVTSMSSENPYREVKKSERIQQILNDLYSDDELNPTDPVILEAVDQMNQLDKSIEKSLLRTAYNGLYELKDFLEKADLSLLDKNDRPVHDAKKYKSMLDDMASSVKNMKELKELVEDGEKESSDLRGGDKPEFNL